MGAHDIKQDTSAVAACVQAASFGAYNRLQLHYGCKLLPWHIIKLQCQHLIPTLDVWAARA